MMIGNENNTISKRRESFFLSESNYSAQAILRRLTTSIHALADHWRRQSRAIR